MQSLSFKVPTDFAGTSRSRPLSFGCGVAEFDFGTRKQWLNFRDRAKICRIVSCFSEGNGGSVGSGGAESVRPSSSSSTSQNSFISRSETYALLKQQMEIAAKSEDYKEAARLRDSLRLFEEEEPILRLRRLLKKAIADERFEDLL